MELKGEAGTEFQRFASDLVAYAYNLASFANVVGAQMKVASTGLASVRSARPPRDTRPDPKKPTDFPRRSARRTTRTTRRPSRRNATAKRPSTR